MLTVVRQSLENQLYLSQLSLLLRSYTNIGIEIEPNENEYFSNRKSIISKQAFEIIEKFRLNIQEINFYNKNRRDE